MEMIQQPLRMTEQENREMLRASELRMSSEGHPEGNRHQRRLWARQHLRQLKMRRRENANAND